jgi:hypothetical protein
LSDPITIRASSWSELFDCAYRWEAKHLLGMTAPSSGPATLGTALHASTAAFDRSRIDGAGVTVTDTAAVLVDAIHHPEQPVDWGDVSPRKAEQVGLRLHARYCLEWSPRYDFTAFELSTTPMDINVDGAVIRLTGTLDRARIRKGEKGAGIVDLKSGARAVGRDGTAVTKGHGAQLGVYELLFEHTTGEAITQDAEIIGAKTSLSDPRIGSGVVSGAKSLLVGTEAQAGLLSHAALMLKSGMFPPNPKSQLCSEKFCPRWATCSFHD